MSMKLSTWNKLWKKWGNPASHSYFFLFSWIAASLHDLPTSSYHSSRYSCQSLSHFIRFSGSAASFHLHIYFNFLITSCSATPCSCLMLLSRSLRFFPFALRHHDGGKAMDNKTAKFYRLLDKLIKEREKRKQKKCTRRCFFSYLIIFCRGRTKI